MAKKPINLKHLITRELGERYNKTVLCIVTVFYTGVWLSADVLETQTFSLKRGYTPEDFGRFLHDLDLSIKDPADHANTIIWYTDGSWSQAYYDDNDDLETVIFDHHSKPSLERWNL